MKNPILAFILAFFPGGGLIYLGKARGILYTFGVFGLPFFFLVLYRLSGGWEFIVFLALASCFLLYLLNFIDTVITASKIYTEKSDNSKRQSSDLERFFTIILSFVPGLGHLQLGLFNRGLNFLVIFFGLATMIFFVTFLTHRSEFLVFGTVLPVIWIFSFFDAVKQLERKKLGEPLVDRTIIEEFEKQRDNSKKSKSIASILSLFPGAGHLYLGYQRRGIQLMAIFLFSIYILDILRLGLFLFFIPIIWFYSFFDGLQKAAKFGDEPFEDTPIITYFINYQRWIGIGLIVIGMYYLVENFALPIFQPIFSRLYSIDLYFLYHQYFQTAVVSFILIFAGIKIIRRSKNKE